MLSSKSKLAAVVGLVSVNLLSSCADYMNRWDSVSLRNGNAPEANTAIQAIEAFPPEANNATIRFGE